MIRASHMPDVLAYSSRPIFMAIMLMAVVVVFSLVMFYRRKFLPAFLGLSATFVLGYLTLTLLAWQDVANSTSCMLMGEACLTTPSQVWIQLPDAVFGSLIYLALISGVLAFAAPVIKSEMNQVDRVLQ